MSLLPLPPIAGAAGPLPLDFSAGPSNAASSTPISIGGINANRGTGIDPLLIFVALAAMFFFRP